MDDEEIVLGFALWQGMKQWIEENPEEWEKLKDEPFCYSPYIPLMVINR